MGVIHGHLRVLAHSATFRVHNVLRCGGYVIIVVLGVALIEQLGLQLDLEFRDRAPLIIIMDSHHIALAGRNGLLLLFTDSTL